MFSYDPSIGIGYSSVNATAILSSINGFTDVLKFSATYNEIPKPISSIYFAGDNANVSVIITSGSGSGILKVFGEDSIGTKLSASSDVIGFVPTLKFANDPKSSGSPITVHVSAIGDFPNDSNYFYAKRNGSPLSINNFAQDSNIVIGGVNTPCKKFDVILTSGAGELIISAGARI